MPGSHSEIYLHFVWTTAGRQPLVTGTVRDIVYECLHAECRKQKVQLVAADGVEDHVHLLVRTGVGTDIARLMMQVKGVSSHTVRCSGACEGFGWQEGYSVFSVSRWDVPRLREYIARQREHHADGTVKTVLESTAQPPAEPGGWMPDKPAEGVS